MAHLLVGKRVRISRREMDGISGILLGRPSTQLGSTVARAHTTPLPAPTMLNVALLATLFLLAALRVRAETSDDSLVALLQSKLGTKTGDCFGSYLDPPLPCPHVEPCYKLGETCGGAPVWNPTRCCDDLYCATFIPNTDILVCGP